MNALQIEIARFLAQQAFNNQRTSYRELASAIGWNHPTGRGMGKHLGEVLNFTHGAGAPCLTSIVCKAGTDAPPDDAITFIRHVYGEIDITTEQERVFEYAWNRVPVLAFEQSEKAEIDFDRMFATRMFGFDPERWGMTGFSSEATRNRILEEMGGRSIFVVYFCSQHAEPIEGHEDRVTIEPADVARVLGIVEAQPERASHETHTDPVAIQEMIELWGGRRWEYGLATSRAWEIVARPWTREVLPQARSTSWEATIGIVPLTAEEKGLIRQYQLLEVPVYGRELMPVAYALREPMNTTYLAICDDVAVLTKTNAPPGTKLVKIGVSGDTSRRLRDLNEHHFAKIFGLSFRMFATQRWSGQDQALTREAQALEWAIESVAHASGEYFYMTDAEILQAVAMVKPPKRVR